jgi:NAD dependent epimerase/dehydratase family enzyme
MPWVHLEDVVGLLLHAAGDESLRGPLNVVSPTPVINAEFTRCLGRALGRPTLLSVPRLALRLAFGELSQALLSSQRVLPGAAERSGYRFRYPELAGALESCIHG